MSCLPDELHQSLGDGSMVEDRVCDALIRLERQSFGTPVTFGRKGGPNLLGVVALEGGLMAIDPVEQRLVPAIGWKA